MLKAQPRWWLFIVKFHQHCCVSVSFHNKMWGAKNTLYPNMDTCSSPKVPYLSGITATQQVVQGRIRTRSLLLLPTPDGTQPTHWVCPSSCLISPGRRVSLPGPISSLGVTVPSQVFFRVASLQPPSHMSGRMTSLNLKFDTIPLLKTLQVYLTGFEIKSKFFQRPFINWPHLP